MPAACSWRLHRGRRPIGALPRPLTTGGGLAYPASVRLPERIGRYQILRLLGCGGMGRVYLGQHQDTGWVRAIKTLRLDEGESTSNRRFIREAKATAEIEHPNVVKIYEFSYDDDEGYYFVMEHLEGEDLHARLDECGPLRWGELRGLLLQAARGLGSAHALGIFHRDIKPSNLFLARTVGGEALKIIDFGIAKIVGRADVGMTNTETAHVVGTAFYVSPEEISKRPVDARSDIYSLGATFYHLLVGAPPFQGLMHEILQQHIERRPVPLREAAPNAMVPDGVEALILRCLEKRPEARFQTTLELEAAVLAIPDPDATTPRLTPAIRRPQRRPWFAVVAVGVLLLLAGTRLFSSQASPALEPEPEVAPRDAGETTRDLRPEPEMPPSGPDLAPGLIRVPPAVPNEPGPAAIVAGPEPPAPASPVVPRKLPSCSANNWRYVKTRIEKGALKAALPKPLMIQIDYVRYRSGIVKGQRSERARKIDSGSTLAARLDGVIKKAFEGCRDSGSPASGMDTLKF